MKRMCSVSGQEFAISEEDLSFYRELEVEPPSLCPDERQRRRLSFRNERTLYRRPCSATSKNIFSIYSADKPFPVYENDYWWSDNWDPREYGREFDFNRPFFEQFYRLQQVVPHCALTVVKPTIENSEYCNQVGYIKNCYLIFDSRRSEQCMYGKTIERCFDCVDCLKVFDCEACYETVACQFCQFCTYVLHCYNCSECHYSRNLIGCSYCFGCTNLRNQKYHLFNRKLSQADWEKEVQTLIQENSREEIWQRFREFEKKQSVKWMQERNTENCTGDYLVDCKDCHFCFDCEYLEKCSYCYDLKKDDSANFCNYDVCHFGGNVEFCYECCSVGNSVSRLRFCENVWSCDDVTYSRICTQSRNLFGCLSLKRGEYCILNKQYSKDEYFSLCKRITEHMKKTGEWGEFFPIEYSPYGYNETLAQEYFPITEGEAEERGWNWKPEEETAASSAPRYVVPQSIKDVSDDIVTQVLTCEATGKQYRITRQELQFYRKMELPLPRLCFEARHARRMALRNPRRLYQRTCVKTGSEILTTYNPEDYANVYCREAYLKAVG